MIDYRRLNAITKPIRFPIPNIQDLVDSVQGKIFLKLDMTSGNWQLQMKPGEEHKTAFSTLFGIFEWRVVPMGLTNAPAAFSRLIERLVGHLPFVWFYLDDIIIFSDNAEDHAKHVDVVLTIMDENKLTISTKKCVFGVPKIEFVGHWISADGISMMRDKLEAITNWPVPQNLTQLRWWMGILYFYRQFVNGFMIVAKPLMNLFKANAIYQ